MFDDGTVIVADAEHGWLTDTLASRKSATGAAAGHSRQVHQRTFASVKTTREISATVRAGGDHRLNHVVTLPSPLRLPEADLPLPPYTLGVWLGDGTSAAASFTSADPEVAMLVEAERIMCRTCLDSRGSVQAILRTLGVLGSKHIPVEYLRASDAQRRALLAGLLDTDGTVGRTGSVHFAVTSRRLASDFRELVLSLGYRCGWSEKPVKGSDPSIIGCLYGHVHDKR